MRLTAAALIVLLPLAPAVMADTAEVVAEVILPGYQKFANATADLHEEAVKTCDIPTLQGKFDAAFDAWVAISFLHFGPSDEGGRSLAIQFWPDPKGLGAKAQRALLIGDPALLQPDVFAKQSVAARGLPGLERLFYPADTATQDSCPLIRATAQDLARLAAEIAEGWQSASGFADALLKPGAAGARFLSADEARQAVFTQLMSGLEFAADQRLGRPLGEPDRPRPERAESRASSRSQRNLLVSLQGMRRLALALEPNAIETLAAFDRAIALTSQLKDPTFSGVSDPVKRQKLEVLQQSIRAIRSTALAEMAPALGVGLGFNSLDGD